MKWFQLIIYSYDICGAEASITYMGSVLNNNFSLAPFQPSCTMGTGPFLGLKRLGRGADHPPPSKCQGHERVELYLYSPSGPSWPVIERTLTFYLFSLMIAPVYKLKYVVVEPYNIQKSCE
jgi:hypothetical protein